MKMLRMKLMGSGLALALAACGGAEVQSTEPTESTSKDREVSAMATCYAYLLDGPNISGAQLAPWPVVAASPTCVNLPAASNNRVSSFRLAGCPATFFDGPNCTGASYVASTSGTMPVAFDNLTSSIYFP